ncbi:glutathione S-transferase T2-like [Primulina tabacum]|uniref:glutathione S-transferase T2-like n=1 Tax=Primulina tabacum TaxID=48773 RepID=UPI003F59B17B
MQCHMKVVLRHIGRLRGCIRQIETLKPSGASEEDIFNRAKDLFMQDSNYSNGFKFDHVWHIMKNIEKFSSDINPSSSVPKIHVTNLDSSQSEAQTSETPISGSPGLHSFSINLSSDENAGGTSSERPIGVKKAKLKGKKKMITFQNYYLR